MNGETIHPAAAPTVPEPGTAAPCANAQTKKPSRVRRGVVIVAVLIVVAALSLAGYHFTGLMVSEYKASEYAHQNVQVRACAESGVHYTTAMLSDPNYVVNKLGNNIWNNPGAFKDQEILLDKDSKRKGFFTILAPANYDDPNNSGGIAYGPSDESAKINLNALMKEDPTGAILQKILIKLPNMTEDVANNIVAWMGGKSGIDAGGAGDDYYTPLGYRAKKGPIDSIDELLLVKGVDEGLLYGTDKNRNGIEDADERGTNVFDRGWFAYLTVFSREQNGTPDGKELVWLSHTDYKLQYDQISASVGEDVAKFIYLCRRRRCRNGDFTVPKGYTEGVLSSYEPDFDALSFPGAVAYPITGPFQVIGDAYVRDDKNKKIYLSPLSNIKDGTEVLVKFLAAVTHQNPTLDTEVKDITGPEIPARININTASEAVLKTLADNGVTPLTANDIAKIISARASLDPTSAISSSPLWLLNQDVLPLSTLRNANFTKRITARTQVYRIQSVGTFGDKGPSVRVEAVIDTNSGRPRILAWRDLSELGKGLPK